MQTGTEKEKSMLIGTWVASFSDELFSWAFYKTSNKELAEDLVQDTFLAAYQNVDKFENRSEPKTWLFAILKNKIADHYRQAARTGLTGISFEAYFDADEKWKTEERPKDWGTQDEMHLLDINEFRQVLSNCLKQLHKQWNASIILKFLEEKNNTEICQELEISPTNYWQIIHRAKFQLRKCLELNWFKK